MHKISSAELPENGEAVDCLRLQREVAFPHKPMEDQVSILSLKVVQIVHDECGALLVSIQPRRFGPVFLSYLLCSRRLCLVLFLSSFLTFPHLRLFWILSIFHLTKHTHDYFMIYDTLMITTIHYISSTVLYLIQFYKLLPTSFSTCSKGLASMTSPSVKLSSSNSATSHSHLQFHHDPTPPPTSRQ